MKEIIELPPTLKESINNGVLTAISVITFLVVEKGFKSAKGKLGDSGLKDLSRAGKSIVECRIDKWEGKLHLTLG